MCFVTRLQRLPTGLLIPIDGSVNFCGKFVVRERKSPLSVLPDNNS